MPRPLERFFWEINTFAKCRMLRFTLTATAPHNLLLRRETPPSLRMRGAFLLFVV